MKRVLIITYYWPPSGGSGVQRWLKMSKYLPGYGWQPVVYTTKDAEYPVEDPSLEKEVCPEAEVIRRPIVEPYNFYKRFLGIKKDQKVKAGFIDESGKQKGWKEKLSVWIRGNFFIPDARCWWVKPSVKYLKKYLKAHPVDALISTGPPHSMHLIALKLKKALNIPWIADFRDPWTEIDFYDELRLSRIADRKHHRLERQVLTQADKVVTVSWNWAKGLERLGASKAYVIQNGYDWDSDTTPQPSLSTEFSITYLGIIGAARNAPALWQALSALKETEPDFHKNLKINLIGQVDQSVIRDLQKNGLTENTIIKPPVPHHEVQQIQSTSQLLLLLVNNAPNAKGILTGKLYEYLASGRPILAVGPEDGDAARVLKETQAGVIVGFEDQKKMEEVIKELYHKYLNGGLPSNESKELEKYSRKALAGEYATLLDKLS